MSSQFTKYGLLWNEGSDDLFIEFSMIRKGGKWKGKNGTTYGLGLFEHYKKAMQLLWPEDDWHRWADLALKEIIENKLCVLMGPGDSNKTYSAAKYAICDYWIFPESTLTMVSSTDVRGLELRVWGTIKDLFNRGRERYEYLDGVVLESHHAITTDEIEDDGRARVLKKGIIGIPCLSGGQYVGLGKYVGVKQKRVRLIADEAQLMGQSFLDAISNLMGNVDFKAVILGNPIDQMDPLGRAGEPLEGWDGMKEPEKTSVWKTKFKGGVCVNFVGTDSPNFDFPTDQAPRFPYMISWVKIIAVEQFWGKDSLQYYSQCKGVMRAGLLAHRVITKDLCRSHNAFKPITWGITPIKKIYALDAAYSGEGGDRCVGGHIEFGKDINGIDSIFVHPPKIVPVSLKIDKIPEDQIAEFVRDECKRLGIESHEIFYDSTGRGTLGSAFARVFKGQPPVPVEFGGRATQRPVRHDLFILEGPPERQVKRLKRCDEHYSKFVTELWFSVRYVIECEQMHNLPEDVMMEGCMREYGIAAGNRIELETKADTKERMGRSPDLFDWLATGVEGARRLGFKIQKLGASTTEPDTRLKWLDDMRKNQDKLHKTKRLVYN